MRLTRWRGILAAVSATTVLAAPLALAGAPTPHVLAPQAPVIGVDSQCFAPAKRIDPQPDSSGRPTNPAWIQRDEINQYCAELRIRDQVTSPAFIRANGDTGNTLYVQQAQEQLADGPGHIHGGFTTLVPGLAGCRPLPIRRRLAEAHGRPCDPRDVHVTRRRAAARAPLAAAEEALPNRATATPVSSSPTARSRVSRTSTTGPPRAWRNTAMRS